VICFYQHLLKVGFAELVFIINPLRRGVSRRHFEQRLQSGHKFPKTFTFGSVQGHVVLAHHVNERICALRITLAAGCVECRKKVKNDRALVQKSTEKSVDFAPQKIFWIWIPRIFV